MAKLTDEQVGAVQQWLTTRVGGGILPLCSICRTRGWDLCEDILELRPYHDGNVIIGGTLYPAFALVCKQCGHMVLINALTAGVLSNPQKSSSPEGGSSNAR